MRKDEKEVLQYQLDREKAILKELEKQYKAALEAIDEKVAALLGRSDANLQHVIFQVEHQKALRRQIEGVLNQLHSNEFDTISDYLANCYEDGFIGSMYSMHHQGIPVIVPIDQNEVTKAVVLDSKISEGLYESIGVDVGKMKKSIRSEITRGISAGMSYNEIARNISNATKAPLSRAKTIVYTEGHRVQQASNYDGQRKATSKGADVVKQWNSILDGNTRPTHRKLDGQIREVDEPFEMDGMKAMFPGDFGDPAEDCNCRCVSMTRAKWALDEAELQTLKDRAEYFGLDKSENFADFKKKYLQSLENTGKSDTIVSGAKGALTSKNDPEFKKRKAHAIQYYTSIRNSDKQSIVNAVSKNTGIASGEVNKAISHLFYEKHDLEKGHTFFEEDYDIAESVQRLREGRNIQPHDLILLRHEAMEADYMAAGMSFEEAHEKTEEDYNYTLALRVFLKANDLE